MLDHLWRVRTRVGSIGKADAPLERAARELANVAVGYGSHARQRADARLQLVDEDIPPFVAVLERKGDVGDEKLLLGVASVLTAQILDAAQEHAGQHQEQGADRNFADDERASRPAARALSA